MAERVVQRQSQVAAKRRQPISSDLAALLTAVGEELDVYFEVTSGGQSPFGEGPRTGSTRHDHGNAADTKAYVLRDGQKHYLDFTNAADRAVWEDIVRLSVAGGATGIGAGTDYMGPQTLHIGYGNAGTWGAGGKGANAPKWLSAAYELGTKTPPMNIPDVGSAMSVAPMPAQRSDRIRLAQLGANDVGEGTASNMLSRMFGSQPNPATMSSPLAYATGRLQDVPLPRPRPSGQTASPSLNPSLSRILAGTDVVSSTRSPALLPQGVGIPNEHIPGNDATYSGANRMSTGGLGALLGARSFSPATPNPVQRPSPSTPAPASFSGVPNYGSRDTVAQRQAGQSFSPPPSGITRTTGGISGTVQMPRDVRPNVPQIAPEFIQQTRQVPNPAYKEVNPGSPSLAAMGFSPGTMPTIPKTISQSYSAPNPAYRQPPMPAMQSAGLAAQRAAATPSNYIRAGQFTYTKGPDGYQQVNAPTPATQSASLAAKRAATPATYGSSRPSSSSSSSVPSGYTDLGGGKFQSPSGGVYYTRHL